LALFSFLQINQDSHIVNPPSFQHRLVRFILTQNKALPIRRFVPKGTDIGKLSKVDVKRIERWMNNYPRRILGYKSPNDYKAA